jgi:hypothetical protein
VRARASRKVFRAHAVANESFARSYVEWRRVISFSLLRDDTDGFTQ